MKTKTLRITEKNYDLIASRNMIIKAIDAQINNYKFQFMTDWEKDHTISAEEKDSKIEALEKEKQELIELCKSCNAEESIVDVDISIEVKIKEPVEEFAY